MADARVPDRRRDERRAMPPAVHAYVTAHKLRVRVRQVSRGGMVIESTEALPVDAVLPFTVQLPDGTTWALQGRVAHSRLTIGADKGERVTYVSGVAFEDLPAALVSLLDGLLTALGAPMDVEPHEGS